MRALDRSYSKTREWLNEIKEELKWDDEEKVYLATKAVLQTVRDRLPLNEAVHFSAGLPMLLKGAYYDEYSPEAKPMKINKPEEFFAEVRRRTTNTAMDTEQATRGVLTVIERKVSQGEIEDIISNFPKELRKIWVPEV